MRRSLLVLLVFVFLVGCGSTESSTEKLTQARLDAMSDEEALALLECQTRKVVEDKGQEEGTKYASDLLMKTIEEDGPPLQAILWEEGYTCEELI